MGYTALAMTMRYIGDGYKFPGDTFLSGVPTKLHSTFGNVGAKVIFHPSIYTYLHGFNSIHGSL